jgi:hypothetical protein
MAANSRISAHGPWGWSCSVSGTGRGNSISGQQQVNASNWSAGSAVHTCSVWTITGSDAATGLSGGTGTAEGSVSDRPARCTDAPRRGSCTRQYNSDFGLPGRPTYQHLRPSTSRQDQ